MGDDGHKHAALCALYQSLIAHCSTMVTIRFAVAAIYAAAFGILAGRDEIPLSLGFIAAIAWLLEIRNANLLENFEKLGRDLEGKLELVRQEDSEPTAFFALSARQPILPAIPFLGHRTRDGWKGYRFPNHPITRWVISHWFGLNLLYFSSLSWIVFQRSGAEAPLSRLYGCLTRLCE